MKKWAMVAVIALGACERPAPAAETAIAGDAASAWIELTGAWAVEGACGDYTQEWRLEAEAFHRHEMHCTIERLELLENGVRAIAQCAVEGDDDRVADVFRFLRQRDSSLSVINEANDAATEGLIACSQDMIP